MNRTGGDSSSRGVRGRLQEDFLLSTEELGRIGVKLPFGLRVRFLYPLGLALLEGGKREGKVVVKGMAEQGERGKTCGFGVWG
ncbi:hypothetical protein HYC85_030990 [Camellia sinensis]|uniref:Uncharacterized protein n=1 Tax=Camellia sinensis TaxID=4442 RepID=A0A7J7FQ77_CAMSI|nr:hypothetical protein HYC85_030990 [Camellia sinensis]